MFITKENKIIEQETSSTYNALLKTSVCLGIHACTYQTTLLAWEGRMHGNTGRDFAG